MYLRHLFTKVCILRWISFVKSQVSHPWLLTYTRGLFVTMWVSILYLHTKLRPPRSNDRSAIVVKTKANLCHTLFSYCHIVHHCTEGYNLQALSYIVLLNTASLSLRDSVSFGPPMRAAMLRIPKTETHSINSAYLLNPWRRVVLEKLTGSAASQEIPRIFGTRRFITIFTSARHLSLSWANSIQCPQPLPLPEDPS